MEADGTPVRGPKRKTRKHNFAEDTFRIVTAGPRDEYRYALPSRGHCSQPKVLLVEGLRGSRTDPSVGGHGQIRASDEE